ncbi:hypothetical protein ACLB1Q_17920 [Escherichia coli]
MKLLDNADNADLVVRSLFQWLWLKGCWCSGIISGMLISTMLFR